MEYLYAFITGGAVCVIGQALMDRTKLATPRILVLFVVAGAFLQGLNLYEPFVEFAGNGATIPLPGFGYALAKGAMEGAKEGFLGALAGALRDTGAGIATAIGFGYIVALVFSPKTAR